MSAVGQTTREDNLVEVAGDCVRDDHATSRNVSGVHALRERDEVGNNVVCIEREPVPCAAKARHDLVEDHHEAVFVAESANALEVAGRGHQYASGAWNGFQ